MKIRNVMIKKDNQKVLTSNNHLSEAAAYVMRDRISQPDRTKLGWLGKITLNYIGKYLRFTTKNIRPIF